MMPILEFLSWNPSLTIGVDVQPALPSLVQAMKLCHSQWSMERIDWSYRYLNDYLLLRTNSTDSSYVLQQAVVAHILDDHVSRHRSVGQVARFVRRVPPQ